MIRWNKSLALLTVVMLASSSMARADVAMANYLPGDVELAVVLDVERALAEPEIAQIIGALDPQLTAQGLPSLSILKSAAFGLDIPADIMGGQKQPDMFIAVMANGSLQGFLDAGMAQGEMQMADIGGRQYFTSPDGDMFGTLSNAKDMALASGSVDGVNKMLGVESAGNVTGKENFDLSSQPTIYAYLGGLDPMLVSQVSAFATMAIMSQAQTPEAQQQIQQIQPALMALQQFKSLEFGLSFDAEFATVALNMHMSSPEAAGQMQTLVKGMIEMGLKQNPATAANFDQEMQAFSFSTNANAFSMIQKSPKAAFMMGLQMGIGQAMAQAGGGM